MATETRNTLSESTAQSVLDAFLPSAGEIASRVWTVGTICTEQEVKPGDVFSDVQAYADLHDIIRPKGWSSSSIANAKTSYDLATLTEIRLNPKRNKAHAEFLKLVDETRGLHGAKPLRTLIRSVNDQYADYTAAPTNDERFTAHSEAITALRQTPKQESKSAPADKTATIDGYILALQKAEDAMPDNVPASIADAHAALVRLAIEWSKA